MDDLPMRLGHVRAARTESVIVLKSQNHKQMCTFKHTYGALAEMYF